MRITPLLLLLAIPLLPACDSETTGSTAVNTSTFLGLEAGRAWDYGSDIDEEWPDEDSLYTTLRTEEASDDSGAIPFVFSEGLEDAPATEFMTVTIGAESDGSVAIHSVDQGGVETAFDPPAVLGPASWDAGDSTSTETSYGGTSVTWTVDLAERGEHEVHYGTFPDVARLEIDDGGGTPLGGTWWLGADVGVVRIECEGDIGDIELITLPRQDPVGLTV